jgi:uncharacterized protein (TIGR00369 family)
MTTEKARTGLEALHDEISDGGPRSPMAKLFDLRVTHAEKGRVTVASRPTEAFNNPMHRTHGGFAATVLDSTLGCAVFSVLPSEAGFGTVELHVNYVRKIDPSTGDMTCTGTVLHSGRTMLTAEAKLVDAQGLLYAHATGTFLVYPK